MMKPNISLLNAVMRITCGLTILSVCFSEIHEKTLVQDASLLYDDGRDESGIRHPPLLSGDIYVPNRNESG